MPKFYAPYLMFVGLFFSYVVRSQTVLGPGDIVVLGVMTDLTGCVGPQSDEISFVCFQDITNNTSIILTDNGWEVENPMLWGDSEGTLMFTRTGGTIPRGVVITFRAILVGAVWSYSFVSPDNNWLIQDLNVPGGPFNLEAGGDQFFFMQGGTWDNMGGGMNKASYDGTVIYGFTTSGAWMADGTTHQSNLMTSLLPCFNMSSGGADFFKYNVLLDPTNQVEWWHRVQHPMFWKIGLDCLDYNSVTPSYSAGYTIPIDDLNIGISALSASGCSPFSTSILFNLPPGIFDIVYTDGTNFFTITGVTNFETANVTVIDTTTFSLVSVVEANGCPVPGPFFSCTIMVPHNNPGTHNTLYVCPTQGLIQIGIYLGVHDPGGQWNPPLDPMFGLFYSSYWGPGKYTYYFKHPGCPSDTASIDIYWVDPSASTFEIGCDQNGTPTDITDDRMTVTINYMATGFGATYQVWSTYLNAMAGSVTPTIGTVGVPTTFYLDPGTATAPFWGIAVKSIGGQNCVFEYPLSPPGWCSDPCDHNMEATLSGDEDTCPNSCPENPAHVYLDISGGFDDYTMDFSIVAPGFPTWTFTNVPVELSTEFQVCVGDVLAAEYDEITHSLIVPKGLTGHTFVFTLLNVYDTYGCTAILDEAELEITVHNLPVILAPQLKFCKGIANNIDLTEYDNDVSPFFDVSWADGDPLNGGELLNNSTGENLFNIVQLWAQVEDDYCINSVQIPLTLLPQPKLDSVPDIQICKGDIVILDSIHLNDLGNSAAMYTFHSGLPPDTTNKINPLSYIPNDTSIVYVLASTGTCFDTLPIEIDVQDYPDFTLQGSPCDMTTHTYAVVFTSSADSIHASAGVVINHLVGQDSIKGIPENVNITIEILNPSGLCKDTFTIVAPNCNCPLINPPVSAQPTYGICEGSPIPVLSVTVDPGMISNWYNVPSGGTALLQNSLTYQPAVAVSAIYYAEAIDPLNSCYSIRTQVPFDVFPVADLQQLTDQELCETGTIDLDALVPSVVNGVVGIGGWFDLLTNQPISGVVQPQNGNTWYYLFTSVPGNCPTSDTMTAIVNASPVVNLFNILCIDAALEYEVSFTSDADIILTNTGTLTNITGTDSFLLSNIPFGTDIQFDLTNSTTGCTNSIFQAAPDCSCPPLLQNSNLQICSDQGNVDLSTFEGLGVMGNWQLVSTPPGSNPATLAGTIFQILNKDAGQYVLQFIRSIILTDCVDTAAFQIQLNRSPFVDAGSNAVVCAPDVIQLAGSGGGDNVLFSWQENGTGTIANPNALITSYTPTLADIAAGSIQFTLTATDQTGVCVAASETITITIDASAYYIINAGSPTYCDTADMQIDLDDFISFGTTNGTWFFPDTVSAPITGSSIFNPSTLTPGSYTVFYTTSNAVAPCKNDTTGVNLIIRNCKCPDIALSSPSQGICSESGTQELNDFLITNEPGTWTVSAKPNGTHPAVINGTKFVTNNSDFGMYTLRYTLSNPVAGCATFAEINIDVISTPSLQINSAKCAADLQSWEVVITSNTSDITNLQGNLTSLGNSQYKIDGLALLTSLQITASNGNGLCTENLNIPAPDCACTLSISNLPDNASLCPNEKITLNAVVSGAKGNLISFWIVSNDSLYQNSLQVGTAGTYHFVSIDELGCREEKLIVVDMYSEMIPDANAVDITCPGDQDGQIILNDITGGTGPFFISINGGNLQPISAFPYIFNGLKAGTYKIDLLDGFSCSISFSISVASVSSETLELGPDKTILTGDSVRINPLISFVPDSFYWTGDISLIDPLLLDNWIKPDVDVEYMLFAVDSKGCLYSDHVKIKVLLHSSIYVPTIFSPNGDGINDLLTPLADPSVTEIDYFEIYSRWGDLVYAAPKFVPGQINIGWDGTFNGKPVAPGVFVYRLSAKNKKDKVILMTGDVTVVK